MESSTPSTKTSKDLRRRTLLRMAETPILTEDVNDESERSSRRSFIEMQKKISSNQAQSPVLNDSVRFSGEQEIKDHFQICTKLHAENKITARVAWQLHIIDLLRVVSKKQRPDTLQVASTSLDIGAKVYSLRVDDIHAAGLKLANSMARFGQQESAPDGDKEENAGDNKENPEAGPTQRKRRRLRHADGPKNTIAKDPKSLLAPVPKLESVFFSTRIDSNMSTVENLFTNRLPMDKSCYKFMVLSQEKAWVTGPDEAVEGLEGETQFDDNFPKGGNICIPFQNFILDKWDIEEEQQYAERSMAQPTNDVLVYDDEGHPVAELDGSVHDIFNDHHDDNMSDDNEPQEQEFIVQQMQHEIANVVDLMRPEDDIRRSEYSYNSVISMSNGKVIDQIWAGPSHWKLKFLRRSRTRFSGAVEALHAQKQKKKLKHIDPAPIDLTNDEIDYEKILDNMKRIRPKKRVNQASKVTLPLPDSSCINLLKNVYELMIKPGTVPVSKKDASGSFHETKSFDNDAQHNVEPDIVDNTHMDNDHGDDFINEEEDVAINNQEQFMGENLVDAPEYVPKAYVPYALQAKKMDMKKLKGHIWHMLANCPLEETAQVAPSTFSEMFSGLPTVLPQTMKKELSCSLAFSALLHLCNDKTLKLTQLPNYQDFKIESG